MKQITTISPEGWTEIEQLSSYSKNLINTLQHESGAYPASPTFSAYVGFSWLRDGAFIADAMSACGVPESAERFFDWCSHVVSQSSHAINTHHESFLNHAGFDLATALPTRFEFEEAPPPDEPWPDHQIDGYGTWLWALQQHMIRFPEVGNRWQESVELSSKYLVASWDSACYDWWEEHPDRVHTSTLGAVQAGLKAALAMGGLHSEIRQQVVEAVDSIDRELLDCSAAGFLPKWHGSEQVDSSALSLLEPFGLINPSDPVFLGTVSKVKHELLHGFGLHRYGSDSFFGGGLWPLLSCYLALTELKAGDRKFAEAVLVWVASLADEAGNLPEQVDDHLLEPTQQVYWIKRWGPSARPLLWTHAMFLKLKTEIEREK
jgi:GH15 family glucan-1,4-alpha-glucosidase